MNFAVTPDEVRTVFGLSGVVFFPRCNAMHSRMNDRTALLLSSVGLPDTEWFMSKASLSATDSINVAQWYSNRGTVPKECHDWLVLGLFADTTLALAPDTGMIYALGDGEDELVYTPIHRDVESLTYALTKFAALRQELGGRSQQVTSMARTSRPSAARGSGTSASARRSRPASMRPRATAA
ncbi:SUKH-4 family immunity protein [Streptomyces sp. NBC_00056]|nr:SUKH-4 family immunity protein [Streptomyces sp. NBC_00063]WUB99039.1 SUKH-4 family immunity protein [Streptomyces sp. NBC_00569]